MNTPLKPPRSYDNTFAKTEKIPGVGSCMSQINLSRAQVLTTCSFFESIDSRSALNCSRYSFCYTLSHHQVPSDFLDFLFSFGSTCEPVDYHMSGFHSGDTLGSASSRSLAIPKLGRTGCEHHMQYLLRTVEPSTSFDGSTTWNIRQMAVHHSFDFNSGKALWINIKTNSVVRKRIRDAMYEFPSMSSDATSDLPGSFAAALITHIIHLDWCDDNWRSCIRDIEREIRLILVKAKTARIDQQPNLSASPAMKKILTMPSTTYAHKTSRARIGIGRFLTQLAMCLKGRDAKDNEASNASRSQPKENDSSNDNNALTKQLDSLMVLDTFSFREMQRLHYLGEQLESFRVVLELNQQTLRDVAEHYTDLARRDWLPEAIKDGCKEQQTRFAQRVRRIGKNLEIRSTQITSLIAWLQDGKSLVRCSPFKVWKEMLNRSV